MFCIVMVFKASAVKILFFFNFLNNTLFFSVQPSFFICPLLYCMYVCIYLMEFIVELANIRCLRYALGFGGRFPWFIAYIQHPELIPTSALLNAHHPPSPLPHPQSTLSLFSVLKSLLWFASLLLCNFFFPFPYPMVFC